MDGYYKMCHERITSIRCVQEVLWLPRFLAGEIHMHLSKNVAAVSYCDNTPQSNSLLAFWQDVTTRMISPDVFLLCAVKLL